jgi:hypothetical protein
VEGEEKRRGEKGREKKRKRRDREERGKEREREEEEREGKGESNRDKNPFLYAVNKAWIYAFAAAITGARTVMDGRICENSKGGGARCRTPCKSQTSIFRLVSVS